MPPKAKKGKKKADEVLEPEHDPSWERVSDCLVHTYMHMLHSRCD